MRSASAEGCAGRHPDIVTGGFEAAFAVGAALTPIAPDRGAGRRIAADARRRGARITDGTVRPSLSLRCQIAALG